MALKVGDRIKQLTNSTGTGDISFVSTPAGFSAFSSVLTSGDTTYYAITENDKYEVGIGTYGDSNMVRTTVLVSSNNNNHINLGGSGVVFITYPSDRSVFRNLDGQVVVGPSGLSFNNGTVIKNAKIGELTDVNSSGTPTSTHVLSFNHSAQSLLIGDSTGPSNSKNILIGDGAGSNITSGYENISIGVDSLTATNAGIQNVSIGVQAGPYEATYTNTIVGGTAIGYQAGSRMRSYSTAVGYRAGKEAYELDFVAIGNDAGYKMGSYSVAIGSNAGYDLNEDYTVAIGYRAAHSAAGANSVWVGRSAGESASAASTSVGIGYNAGKSSSANDSIYIGPSAGISNSNNDYLYIGNASPSSNGSLIKGDMQNKMLAVGAADITLTDTFYIGIPASTKKGLVVKSAAAQSAVLSDWQTSAGVSVAALSNSGVITANAVFASGNGIKLADGTPDSTVNTLYNRGGAIYWNGAAIETSALDLVYVSGIAVYASGNSLTNATNIIATSGIANYASGQAIANESDIVAVSGVASYASGNSLTNATNIIATSGIAAYASGIDLQGVTNNGSTTTNSITTSGNIVAQTGVLNVLDMTPLAEASYPAHQEGVVFYDNDNHTLSLYNDESDVTLQLGQEEFLRVRNNTGATITNGQAVLITGSHGNAAPAISGAIATTEANSQIVGLATHDIETDTFGYVTTYGVVRDVDTSHCAAGDEIFLSATQIGSGVNVAPTIPNYKVTIGHVIRSHASNGSILVQIGHPKLGGGDLKSEAAVALSGVPFVTSIADTNAGGMQTSSEFVYDSGNKRLHLGSGGIKFNDGTIQTTADNDTYVSGVATYASGQAIENESDIVAVSGIAHYASGHVHDDLYVSGIATYASGQAIANESDIATNTSNISTNTSNISTNTARVNYASGLAIENESDILALLDASGTATSLISTSGIAAYASGNTANITFGSNAEGDMLFHNGTSFVRLAKGVDDYILKMNGNQPNWEAESSGGDVTTDQLNYVSGIAVYSSGQAIENEGDIVAVSGIANYASGNSLTNATNIIATSGIANYASGNSLTNASNIIATSGIANYASGNSITNATNIVATSGIANYASGQAIENEGNITALLDASGTATALISTSGIAAYASGNTANITFGSNAEGDMLFHNGTSFVRLAKGPDDYILKMNGNQPNWEEDTGGGGDVTTAQLNYVSGIAVYSSGQAIANESDIVATSGIANYASGQAISNQAIGNYASGQAIENESDIVAVSGIAHYASGHVAIANYASGQAIENETIATYASGNSITNATNIIATSGIANYASGQAIANESDILALIDASGTATALISTSGIATYASGNTANITFGSNAEGDMLFHNGSNFIRLAKGVDDYILKMNGNSPNWEAEAVSSTDFNYVSGVANYASGQAIENETAIATNTSNISTNTSNISTNTGRVNYASGQAIENESDIAALLDASGTATALISTSGIATYASGNTANIVFGSNAEGDLLYHNGTSFVRLARGSDDTILKMNGNVPNWEAESGGGGSPGGSDTQVQFNDGGSFGGDADFTWNKTSNILNINGTLAASLKSFVIDHPTKEGMRLQYTCLEGPENGVYVRGAVDGNVIELPDYWTALVDEDSITVQLTAKGYSQPDIYVEKIEANKIYLNSEQPINAYYIVHATRKDVDPLETEWPK